MHLAFYRGPRQGVWKLVSALARWRTRGPYDHVEIVFSDGVTGTSSLPLGGPRLVERKPHPAEYWHIVSGDFDEAAARLWFERQQGAAFDILGLVGFLFGFTRGDESRWFCSEAVAAALGFPDPWRFDPNTLHAAVRRDLGRAHGDLAFAS